MQIFDKSIHCNKICQQRKFSQEIGNGRPAVVFWKILQKFDKNCNRNENFQKKLVKKSISIGILNHSENKLKGFLIDRKLYKNDKINYKINHLHWTKFLWYKYSIPNRKPDYSNAANL